MNAMIQDLVDSARLESGKLTIKPHKVALPPLIAELKQRLAGVTEVERIRLDVDEGLRPVLVDPNHVERILMNLLSNALKYSASTSEIRLAAKEVDDGLAISVSDEGPGIPAEEVAHLFERYHRAPDFRERKEAERRALAYTLQKVWWKLTVAASRSIVKSAGAALSHSFCLSPDARLCCPLTGRARS